MKTKAASIVTAIVILALHNGEGHKHGRPYGDPIIPRPMVPFGRPPIPIGRPPIPFGRPLIPFGRPPKPLGQVPVTETTTEVATTAAPVTETTTEIATTAAPVPVTETTTEVATTAAPVNETTTEIATTAAPVNETTTEIATTTASVEDSIKVVPCRDIDVNQCSFVEKIPCNATCGEGVTSFVYDCGDDGKVMCYRRCEGIDCIDACRGADVVCHKLGYGPCSKTCGVGIYYKHYICNGKYIECPTYCCCQPCPGGGGVPPAMLCKEAGPLPETDSEDICP